MRYANAGMMFPIRCDTLQQDRYVVVEQRTQVKATMQTYDLIRFAKRIDFRVSFDFDAVKVLRANGYGVFKIFEEKSLTETKKFSNIKLHQRKRG